MNNNYLQILENKMVETYFLIIMSFFSNKGKVYYKLFNIIVDQFFNKNLLIADFNDREDRRFLKRRKVIYKNGYIMYVFSRSEYYDVLFDEDCIEIKIKKEISYKNSFQLEFKKLDYLYSYVNNLEKGKLEDLYSKIL